MIFVAAWRGAVFTVDEEALSGAETLDTTDETVDRSTVIPLVIDSIMRQGQVNILFSGSASSSGALSSIEPNSPK